MDERHPQNERQPSEAKTGGWRAAHWALLLAALFSWLALSGMNLWMGELNQDEGWYLYAAGQIREGRLPYRDFAFTQPPLLPLIYSWGYHWIERHGVAGGRALTWFFGAAGLLASVWLAVRTGPRRAQRFAGGLCFLLIAVNLYQSYFTVVVKTYALSGMFLAAGLAVLSHVGRRRAFLGAFTGGLLLAMATATRLSMGAALGLGFLYLLIIQRRLRRWAWLDYALGGGLGLALTLLLFLALGGEGFRFGLFEYHTLRDAGPWPVQAAYKAGALSRLIQAYFPAVLAGLLLLLAALRRAACGFSGAPAPAEPPSPPREDMPPGFNAFVWSVVAVLGLVHLAAPFPYDDYQVPVYPIFCAALAATGARWWLRIETRRFADCTPASRSARRLALLTGVWLVCGLHAFSSPMAQDWFVAGRDRIWWRLREQSAMSQLRATGAQIRERVLAEGGGELLTQDTYLAVEARLPVPRGFEMGPFSYYPDWSRERAERIGVLNRDMMRDQLASATTAPIAAFSGYGLAIRSPEIEEVSREDRQMFEAILAERFEWIETVPAFGQAATPLDIWRLRREEKTQPMEPAEE